MDIKVGDRFICKNEELIVNGKARRIREEVFDLVERTVTETSPSGNYIGFQQSTQEEICFWLGKDLFEKSIVERIMSMSELVNSHKLPKFSEVKDKEYSENEKTTMDFMKERTKKLKHDNKDDDWKEE